MAYYELKRHYAKLITRQADGSVAAITGARRRLPKKETNIQINPLISSPSAVRRVLQGNGANEAHTGTITTKD